MNIFDIVSILVTLSALLMYINFKYIKLPTTIGLMGLSLILSFIVYLSGYINPSIISFSISIIDSIDFNKALMGGMLSFLLFAGALHVDINDLFKQKTLIAVLATLGVVFSTIVVGSLVYYLLPIFGLQIDYIYCLLFGALISPTDPIAVLGILKETSAPKSLETTIAGESLFNDGVGVVVFTVILSLATGGADSHINVSEIFLLFIEEALGGIVYGFVLGYIFYRLLKSIDNYAVEILLTLSLVMGGYSLAYFLHVSGPLAMVVAGLFIGNHGKVFAMSEITHKQLFSFWELIDEFLNAVLFVLIGIEVLAISFNLNYLLIGIIIIPIILCIRFIGVATPIIIMRERANLVKGASKAMTWCGLRGGISIALALSIPDVPEKPLILAVTYIVVAFSILVQGLSSKKLIDHILKD
jgi:CPA1 family monovalent cation:H+ antiporter